MTYNPYDWYWLAEDGRLFSSARQAVLDEADEDYLDWTEAGGLATAWPCDAAGAQTSAALQDVVGVYGLSVTLANLKASLKLAIDTAAERERMRYLTGGAGQAMTYTRKVEQARAVQADADPQPEDYLLLAASIGIDGDDIQAVAATILGLDAAWEQIGAAIEAVRLTAKRAVDLAPDAAAAAAVTPLWPEP